MGRITLRLPDSLHKHISECAQRESVSMNQYILYALSRVTTTDEVNAQKKVFESLLTRFPEHEAESALRSVLSKRE